MTTKSKFFSNKVMQYIESCIYILVITMVIIANTYGPIYIKMIPLLFLLGVIGKLFFGRPVVTTIFGITMSLCVIYARSNVSLIENIILSFSTGLNIALGELLGDYVKIIYKRLENKKSVSKKKLKKSCILSIVVILVSFLIHDYTNGNFFVYKKCTKRLYSYLEETYGSKENFEIVNAKYNFIKNKSYVIRVKSKDYNEINRFVIYLEDIFIVQDGYKQSVLAKNNIKIYSKFKKFCEEKSINTENLYVNLKYTDIDKLEIYIDKNINESVEENVSKFAKDVDEFLKSIQQFEYYNKIQGVNITLNNTSDITDVITATFEMNGYTQNLENNKSYEYIMSSLTIEFLGVEI